MQAATQGKENSLFSPEIKESTKKFFLKYPASNPDYIVFGYHGLQTQYVKKQTDSHKILQKQNLEYDLSCLLPSENVMILLLGFLKSNV